MARVPSSWSGVAVALMLVALGGCGSSKGGAEGPTSAPSAPTDLVVTNLTASSVLLAWTDTSDNEAGFKIGRNDMMSGTPSTIDVPVPNSTSYTDTGLITYGYSYTVRAYNALGDSAATDAVTVWVGDPVSPPTNLVATAASAHGILLSWTASASDAYYFDVERSTTSATAGFTQISTSVSSPFSVDDCSAATTYWFRIRQVSHQNVASPYSNVATATTTAGVSPPSNLSAIPSGSSVLLSWTASPTSAVTYSVLRHKSGYSASSIASGLTSTSYTDSSASAGAVYFYAVSAVLGSDKATTSEASVSLPFVYTEVENNGPTSWASSNWYYFGDSLTGYDVFEVLGGYSGSYAIYNPSQYENYDYDIYRITLARGDTVTFVRHSGNVDPLNGMEVSLEWVDSSDVPGGHSFAAGGETYAPWLNLGQYFKQAYIQVSIPTSITGQSYDFSFTIGH
jgi:hypothetical protein